MGGKLGDFLHAMFAVKHMCQDKNQKANVYMYDVGWEFGIQNTYSELLPIMMKQDYIESFNILSNCEIDLVQTPENNTPVKVLDEKLIKEGFIDLGGYIRSSWLYKTCWSELYSRTFNFPISKEYQWIKYDIINKDLVGKVLIHRRYNPIRISSDFPHKQIIETYGKDVIFISSSDKDYEEFPYKQIPFFKVKTLDDWFTSINSCSLFVSNLTSPAVISSALDKLRIIELPNIIDAAHTIGEERHSENAKWFMSEKFNNL